KLTVGQAADEVPGGELAHGGVDLGGADLVAPRQRGVPRQPPARLVVHERGGYPVREHGDGRPGRLWRSSAAGRAGRRRAARDGVVPVSLLVAVSRHLGLRDCRPASPLVNRFLAGPRHAGHFAWRREAVPASWKLRIAMTPGRLVTTPGTAGSGPELTPDLARSASLDMVPPCPPSVPMKPAAITRPAPVLRGQGDEQLNNRF